MPSRKSSYAEANARTITLGVGWLAVGSVVIPAAIFFAAIVVIVLTLMGFAAGQETVFFVSMMMLASGLLAWMYFVSRKSAAVFPGHRLVHSYFKQHAD